MSFWMPWACRRLAATRSARSFTSEAVSPPVGRRSEPFALNAAETKAKPPTADTTRTASFAQTPALRLCSVPNAGPPDTRCSRADPVLCGPCVVSFPWWVDYSRFLQSITTGGSVRKNKRGNAPEPARIGNRWAGPAMMTSGIIGLLWIVVFYTTSKGAVHIPYYSDLGNWNLVIGMGFIVAAFGFATKWE